MSQTRRSGPRHRGRPDITFTQAQGNQTVADLPTAPALLLPRTGRRTMDAAVVTRCPWCAGTHLHRGLDLNGAVRDSGCVPAQAYQLAVAA